MGGLVSVRVSIERRQTGRGWIPSSSTTPIRDAAYSPLVNQQTSQTSCTCSENMIRLIREAQMVSSTFFLHFCWTVSLSSSQPSLFTERRFWLSAIPASLQRFAASSDILRLQSCVFSGYHCGLDIPPPLSNPATYQPKQNLQTEYPIWGCLVSILAPKEKTNKAIQAENTALLFQGLTRDTQTPPPQNLFRISILLYNQP